MDFAGSSLTFTVASDSSISTTILSSISAGSYNFTVTNPAGSGASPLQFNLQSAGANTSPVLADGHIPLGSTGTSGTTWIHGGTATEDTLTATADGTRSARISDSGRNIGTADSILQSLGTPIPNSQTSIDVGLKFYKTYTSTVADAHIVSMVFWNALQDTSQTVATDTNIYADSGWLDLTATNITATFEVAFVEVVMDMNGPNDSSETMDTWVDDIYVTYGGKDQFAPPTQTGGGTGTACDTCHEFGPNDDYLCLLYTSPSPRDRS